MSERDMDKLKALLERRLGMQWADIVEWLRQTNGLEDIERRLVTGRLDELITGIPQAAQRLADETHQAYVEAGRAEAGWLDEQRGTERTLIRFDTANNTVIDRQRRNELAQVYGLTTETREVIRGVLIEGAATGANPREIARRIRDSIGLTPQQEQWVTNYRRALEQQDYERALGYELSSGNADRSVRAAQRRGVALSPERIDAMVEEYRRNAIAYRAEVIARTESMRAVHEGTEELHRQAVERGDIEADQLIREWHTASDGRVRDSHRTMNGQKRRAGEPFVTATGAKIMYPGDPSAPIAETAQCRCTVSTSFADPD